MAKIKALICTIGDEILLGQILDTNSQWLSLNLSEAGIQVKKKMTIPDDRDTILQALEEGNQHFDITIFTGGLGPTKDDITKKTIADYFGVSLVEDKKILETVTGFFAKRGKKMLEVNKLQAWIPEGCKPLYNEWGTAPGMWMEKEGRVFISLPGVPHEMRNLMESQGIPGLKEFFNIGALVHKTLKTIGIGESYLMEIIGDWENAIPENLKLAYLPSAGEVKLRLTASGENEQELIDQIDKEFEKVIPSIEKYIYGFNGDNLANSIGKLLESRSLTISAAESCTGGYISHLFTDNPGSSNYFMGSIVSYDNEVKINSLGVDRETLEKHGAVSKEVVEQMAEGVRKRLNTDIGIATSGIAGPGGGTEEKPVGTVWIAYSDKIRTWSKVLKLVKDRSINIQLTSKAILNSVRLIQTGKLDKE